MARARIEREPWRSRSREQRFIENGKMRAGPTKPRRTRCSGRNGAGGVRTLDTGLSPYAGLANRCLQPLGHRSSARRPTRKPGLASQSARRRSGGHRTRTCKRLSPRRFSRPLPYQFGAALPRRAEMSPNVQHAATVSSGPGLVAATVSGQRCPARRSTALIRATKRAGSIGLRR